MLFPLNASRHLHDDKQRQNRANRNGKSGEPFVEKSVREEHKEDELRETGFHGRHTAPELMAGWIKGLVPMQRAGSPAEIALAIAFLASEDASYITGATLDVNGGMAMY